jgi:uncharacterized protein
MRQPVPAQARLESLCLALLVLVLAVFPTAAPGAEVLHGQGLLWRIERQDAPPSHVFGTVHSADPQVVDLPPPVADALAASADVVLEVVQTDETSDRTLRAGLLRSDQDLRSILGEDLFERVAVVGDRYGLPAPQLRRFKPWPLIMLFSVPHSELARRAARDSEPLDALLQHRAEAAGVAVHGLETADEQIEVFEGLAMESQIALLEATVADNGRIDEWWRELKRLYLERDLAAIYRIMREQAGALDEELGSAFVERLVDRRNLRMVRRLAPHLAKGRAFVAIGALHLPGGQGVLAQLERQGYRVTRVY